MRSRERLKRQSRAWNRFHFSMHRRSKMSISTFRFLPWRFHEDSSEGASVMLPALSVVRSRFKKRAKMLNH